jgi:DNA helicase HerA-like ATPase
MHAKPALADRTYGNEELRSIEVAREPLGRVASVSGSQVIVEFSIGLSWPDTNLTVGAFLGIAVGSSLVVGALSEMSLRQGSTAAGRMDLLGEIATDDSGAARFQYGVTNYPNIGSPIMQPGSEELRIIFDVGTGLTINVGRAQQNSTIGARIDVDAMVQKHFAILGSTGAGKSSGVVVILREIMKVRPNFRILLIDPHNEYGHCFEDRAHVMRPGNLKLPFWILNFDEMVEVVFGQRTDIAPEVNLLAELIPLAKNQYLRTRAPERTGYRQIEREGARHTMNAPVPYRLDDLIALAESRMGKLENGAVALHYQRLAARINEVRKNPRYSFIFDEGAEAGGGMVDILCQLFPLQGEAPPMTVIQLAGFPAELLEIIVSVLFRLAFEFGLWSDGSFPLLMVCEEAHNYAHADRAIGFRPAREGLSRLAKEGRKYGVFLGLVTQRPNQLDPTLVSQCSTVFAMRMGHEDDQKIVRAAVSDNRLLAFLPSLGTREALVIGAGVPVVTRMRFHDLPDSLIPKSQAVWGGRIGSAKLDKQSVAAVVTRWSGVATSNKPAGEPARSIATPIASHGALDWSVAAPAQQR